MSSEASSSDQELSRDAIFGGALHLWQATSGYRFGLDALLLATDLPELAPGATVVELGAAQGPVSLTVAWQRPDVRVVAVERQPDLARLLRRNVAENGLENVVVIEGDLRQRKALFTPQSAALVLANPPYYPQGSRRPSENAQKAQAHHELHGTLGDFVRAAAYLLQPRGWLQLIAPPVRHLDVVAAAGETDLRLAQMRHYHDRADRPAYLSEYRFRRPSAPDLKIRPPLMIRDAEGHYSPEVRRRLGMDPA
ncbi:tRNA1(Val) (adenine(37)-N6)-methyltransferase [Lujinxingia litoralis]|nr:methyltransferase [Lujinxingia litoralis]